MSDFTISGVYDLPTHHASAAFTSKTSEVFKEDDNIAPIIINERMQYIPWGGDNQMPFNIISLIESDEILSTCQMFNAEVCYGSGLVYDTTQATAQTQQAVDDFTADNDIATFFRFAPSTFGFRYLLSCEAFLIPASLQTMYGSFTQAPTPQARCTAQVLTRLCASPSSSKRGWD